MRKERNERQRKIEGKRAKERAAGLERERLSGWAGRTPEDESGRKRTS